MAKITILLPAKDIPENTHVRKPLGTKIYKLSKKDQILIPPSIVLRVSDDIVLLYELEASNIEAVIATQLLAVDFDTYGSAIQFITELEGFFAQ